MLEKLLLHQFQCHERIVVEFDPLVTSITGPSRVGKTSLIRALKFLSLNKPSGNSFIQHGKDSTRVSLWVDGHKISRQKSNTVNAYKLDDQIFKAFSTSIPDPISHLLNIGEENFQFQHATPFWLFDSAGQVAQRLNRIINLNEIDDILTRCTKAVRDSRYAVQNSESRLAEARKRRDELEWVKEADEKLSIGEALELELRTTHEKRSRINSLVKTVEGYSNTVETSLQGCERLQKGIALGKAVLDKNKKISGLLAHIKNIKSLQKDAIESRKKVAEIEKEIDEKMEGVCPVCRKEI